MSLLTRRWTSLTPRLQLCSKRGVWYEYLKVYGNINSVVHCLNNNMDTQVVRNLVRH